MTPKTNLQAVRERIAVLEAGNAPDRGVLPFGDARLDQALPGGGLPLGRWHEAGGEGLELETGAAAGAFVGRLAAPLAERGAMVWILRKDDLHAPGLESLGLPARRLIHVLANDEAEALAAMEDALATHGVAAAIAEAGSIDLVAGRRLQLACEKHGATGFVIRRRPYGGAAPRESAGSAASTRWKVTPALSQPAPGEPGLGVSRWRVALERCRGGRTGQWLLEQNDGAHPFRVVAGLGDRELAPALPVRLAG